MQINIKSFLSTLIHYKLHKFLFTNLITSSQDEPNTEKFNLRIFETKAAINQIGIV